MAVELATVLPSLLDSMVPNASSVFAPGVAPVTVKGRYHKWLPRDFHVDAVPYDSSPSAAQITNTANAINNAGLEDCVMEFERGTYWVDRTVHPLGGSSDVNLAPKTWIFNETTISAGGSLSNYEECICQGGSGAGLAGLDDTSDNLPPGETTRVLFDVTNCERNQYPGSLHLDGQNKAIALIAAANRSNQDAASANGSCWGHVHLFRAKWGLFGTPKYGQARAKYAGAFVGNVFQRLRVEGNVDIPMLFGGNTCDDSFFGELNIIQKAGTAPLGRSYLFGAGLVCGTAYTNGKSDTCVFLDMQDAHFNCQTIYAELDFFAPIWARSNTWVEGVLKYGAGNPSTFLKRGFVYNDSNSGGGFITAHERSGDGNDINALVVLGKYTGGGPAPKRNYWVSQVYKDTGANPQALPIAYDKLLGDGSTINVPGDQLFSFSQDGFKKWVGGGTWAVPTIAGTAIS